jgi:Tfp pilus assembly protein PilX
MKQIARGFALPTLMIMLALASIATLLAMRNLWVNDQLLNAEADQLRALHKAEAAMPVALADILGSITNSNGTTNLRHTAGNSTQTHAFFPTSMADYDLLRQRLSTDINSCNAGICAPHTLDAKAVNAGYWKTQTTSAMPVSTADTPYGDNTTWYWIEVLPEDSASAAAATSPPPFVYRITALAHGVMPGSATVLQAVWARHSNASLTGQWHSWHVLHD